jgi:L,D-transpeptidase YcbB
MLEKTLLRLVAAGAVALGPTASALGQDVPAQNAPVHSAPLQDPGAANAAPAPSDGDALVFSTETQSAKPIVSAKDVPVAEQLRNLIENEIARHIPRQEDRAGVEAFYRNRGFAPIWVSAGAPLPRAKDAIAFLDGVAADGLEPADYVTPMFSDASAYRAAVDELLLTKAVLTFARHASTGRTAFTRVSASIYFDLKHPDPNAVLKAVSEAADVRAALDAFHPPHPAYRALKEKLAAERGSSDRTEQVRIPGGPLLRPGADDDRVPALRQRLGLPAGSGLTYDEELVAAVRAFQESNNLQQDGIVGPATLSRINGETQGSRIDIIIANMERWRWMPRELGAPHVIVNIPDYTLKVVDRGSDVWSTRVVVGRPGVQSTPLFTETMKFITVNPTWNVPPSIIRNEYLPALQRDPNALERIGLRMTRNRDGTLRIYQPPGDRNALGRIRFNFPNKFLIFQHDTPDKHLFDRTERAHSAGCIRVESPEKYAEVLLSIAQPHENYTAERIESLYGPNERTIKFETPIPVYMTYQTAFVDETGELQIRRDIYGHDKAIADILRDERAAADVPIPRDYHSSSRPVMATAVEETAARDPFGSFARSSPFERRRPFAGPPPSFDRHTGSW